MSEILSLDDASMIPQGYREWNAIPADMTEKRVPPTAPAASNLPARACLWQFRFCSGHINTEGGVDISDIRF